MKNQKTKSKSKWPKLPKRFKVKWLKALRSGDYKQGHSDLKSKELNWFDNKATYTYCCLGVAGEIAGHKLKAINQSYLTKRHSKVPACLQGKNELTEKLANMNDGDYPKKSKSFKQIADWIERNL